MSQKIRLLDVFEGNRRQRIVLIVSVLAFLILEVIIYLAAASDAGQKSRIIVTDANGAKVYETLGSALTSYEKLNFENSYGSLSNYRVQLQTDTTPFPFRAWVSAAVGVPVGLVLLVSFLVRVYLSLLYGEEKDKSAKSEEPGGAPHRFASINRMFHGISVFHIGFLTVLAVLLLWMVPNFIGDFAKITFTAMREHSWFFGGAAVFLASMIAWVIYLRYRLSKKMLDNQLDLEKFRVEKQLLLQAETSPLLPDSMDDARETSTN